VAPLGKPFHVTVASKGPHVPSTPAPWYSEGTFIDPLKAPRTPDYNASAELLADHHWLIAQQGIITDDEGATIDELFRNRWRTLLSIDDAIVGVHKTIEDLGLIDNTYFFVTSDHGYNLGQHRLPSCKLNVYDHDIRIPMVIKGPGIKPGQFFDFPASNVDVGPSFLGLAGITQTTMDGKSVIPQLVDPSDPSVSESTRQHIAQSSGSWRDYHLVEYYSLGSVTRTGHLVDDPKSNTYRAIRSTRGKYEDMLYAEFTAVSDMHTFTNVTFYEYYNMTTDPHQLHNIYHDMAPELQGELHALVDAEFHCQGATCA